MAYSATLDTTNNLVTLQQTKHHLGMDTGFAQVVKVEAQQAGAGGGIGAEYWQISSTVNDYYVWYDISNSSVDPAVSNRTGIEVDVASTSSAAQVASATNAAVTAVSGMTSTVSSATITVTNDSAGDVTAPTQGTTPFVVEEDVIGTSGDADFDNTVTDLINSVSWFLNSECDRKLSAQSLTEIYDGPADGRLLYLRNPPVASLTLSQDSERTFAAASDIASTDYVLYTETGRLVLVGTSFFWDIGTIQAVYTGGFSTIPYDLQETALELIAQRYRASTAHSENKDNITNDAGSETYYREMSPWNLSVIAHYRRKGGFGLG